MRLDLQWLIRASQVPSTDFPARKQNHSRLVLNHRLWKSSRRQPSCLRDWRLWLQRGQLQRGQLQRSHLPAWQLPAYLLQSVRNSVWRSSVAVESPLAAY